MDVRGENLRELLLRQMMGTSGLSLEHCFQIMTNEIRDGVDPLAPGVLKRGIMWSLTWGSYGRGRRVELDLVLEYYVRFTGHYGNRFQMSIPEITRMLWDDEGQWKARGLDYVLGRGGLQPLVPAGLWDEDAWYRAVAGACVEAFADLRSVNYVPHGEGGDFVPRT